MTKSENWKIENIHVGNVTTPPGETPRDEPTTYHSPRIRRTIMGGPGNRSSINGCTCGGSFDGVYVYVGHERRVHDWYARHAEIVGGGDAVARILRQYDEALDAIDYPDHPRISGKIAPRPLKPEELLGMLRTA